MSLPIRLDPIDGESLSGYMLRLSSTYGIPPGDVGRNIGFWPVAQDFDSRRSGYRLDLEQVRDISAATGIPSDRIRSMTLEHLNGKVFRADPSKQIARGIPAAIGKRITTWDTAYCPLCLKEHGTWFLNWHSRWNLICEEHECVLNERCPDCGKAPSALRRIAWPAGRGEVEKDPTCCWWAINKKLCRGDLKKAEVTQVSAEVLEAHRKLTAAVVDGQATVGGSRVNSVSFIADLMGLMYLVRLDETAAARELKIFSEEASGQAHEIATSRAEKLRLLPRAMELADLESGAALADEIRRIGNSVYERAKLRLPQLRIFPGHSEPFGEAMSQARATCCYANVAAFYGFDQHRHRRPSDLDLSIEPRHVPQLFWGHEFDSEIWPLFEGIDFTRWRGRRLCSILLLRLLKPMSWEEGALELGFPPDRYGHKAMTQGMSEFTSRDRAGDLVAAVKEVANRKAASGELVDFRQLEQMMAEWEGVDSETYRYLQPKYKPVKQHSAHVRQRSFVSTMIWAEVTERDETLAPFWRGRGPYEATLFRQKNMHRIGARLERLREIVRQNPGSSIQLHRGMLIGDLTAHEEISPRFRRHELSPELVDRSLRFASHHTGDDIPSMLERVSDNTRPAAVNHARILAGWIMYRLGGSYWNEVNDILGSIRNPARSYMDKVPGFHEIIERLAAEVRDGRTALPKPAGPEPHLDRMIVLASQIRSAVERRASHRVAEKQQILASMKACEEHTDLTWLQLEQVHEIERPELVTSPFRGVPLDEDGKKLLEEVLPEADQLRIKAGYGNSDMRRGLTVAA